MKKKNIRYGKRHIDAYVYLEEKLIILLAFINIQENLKNDKRLKGTTTAHFKITNIYLCMYEHIYIYIYLSIYIILHNNGKHIKTYRLNFIKQTV